MDRGLPTASNAICLVVAGGSMAAAGAVTAAGWVLLALPLAVLGVALLAVGLHARFDA